MVEFKVLGFQEGNGAVTVKIHIPSQSRILPIAFAKSRFEEMEPEEMEIEIANMLNQLYPPATAKLAVGEKSKLEIMKEHFKVGEETKPVLDSTVIISGGS
jgi:hypothetical protein